MTKRTRVSAPWIAMAGLAGFLPLALSAEPAADPAPGVAARTWPMRLESGADRIAIHTPRWESFSGEALTGRAAASITTLGAEEPTFGAIRLECRTESDRVARTVRVVDVAVTQARFPGVEGAADRTLTEAIRRELAERPWVLVLDDLTAQVEATAKEAATQAQLQHAPPRIVFRFHPAVKVQYDGSPLFGEVKGSTLLRVVNTPFLVVMDPATKTFYLKGTGRWFSAPDALGPFQDVREVPEVITAFAERNPDLESLADPAAGARSAAVEVVTATEPTELIWTDGPPKLAPVAGTDLLYIANTDSDVFLRITTQEYYVLLSGRWYVAPRRDGPWTHVPPNRLPADFSKIPPGGSKGDVLAHVAGTPEAREALIDSNIPQATTVDRQKAERPPVAYDGQPQFKDVEGLPVRYAVNTVYSVLEVGGRYYCCYNGVWYDGASPLGPWAVCDSVPASIYELPPSCPLYNVRYVYVYDATPSVVTCGYLPGYLGYYPYDGVVVYGTGYCYEGWYGNSYYPYPCTFGYGAHYSGCYGGWGFSVGFGGPCSWFGLTIGYGGWATCGGYYGYHHGGGWWGCGGYRHHDDHHENDHHDGGHHDTQTGYGDVLVSSNRAIRGGSDRTGQAAVRPPGFTSYGRGGDRPPLAGGNPGAHDGTRPPSVTPDRNPGHGSSAQQGATRPDRGGGRDPLAGRDGTRGGGNPSAVPPGRDRDPGSGTTQPPGWARTDRGARDSQPGRDGTPSDGRPSVVPPGRDRDPGSAGNLPPGWVRTDRGVWVREPSTNRPGERVGDPSPANGPARERGPIGRTDGTAVRGTGMQGQPPAGDFANRYPGITRPGEPPPRTDPASSGWRRGGSESAPPSFRGSSVDRAPSNQRSSPPDRGSGSFGAGRSGGPTPGSGFSSPSPGSSGSRPPSSSGGGGSSHGSSRGGR
jgi:hypothetical protein